MSMYVHKLITHLSASEALTLIEVLDQLRDGLMEAYGEQIEQMLKEAQAQTYAKDEEKCQTIIPFDDDPF